MDRKSNLLLTGFVVCILVGFYLYQIMRGTGPLDLAKAEQLVAQTFRTEVNRVEVIAPDGELAMALPSAFRKVRAIACPKVSSRTGTLPGRYGGQDRTYGAAAFECLFAGHSPSGTLLHFSIYVYRSADPSAGTITDGHVLMLQRSDSTRALMTSQNMAARSFDRREKTALWDKLAREDIYVPADKTRASPLEKALQNQIKKMRSQ